MSQNYSLNVSFNALTVREPLGEPCSTQEQSFNAVSDLCNLSQESLQLLTLNTKNIIIDRKLIFLGSLNASVVHPREIFRQAIADNAASIILAHNHPSGSCVPSTQDLYVTAQIVAAGRLMQIAVLDHLIVGPPDVFTSLRFTHPQLFRDSYKSLLAPTELTDPDLHDLPQTPLTYPLPPRPSVRLYVSKCHACGAWSPLNPHRLYADFCMDCGGRLTHTDLNHFIDSPVRGVTPAHDREVFFLEGLDVLT